MSDLTILNQNKGWLRPSTMQEAMALAEYMAKAEEMVPKAYRGKPNAIFMAMVKANELGLPTTTVMENNYPIEGQLAWKTGYLIQYANSCGALRGPIKFKRTENGKFKVPGRAATPDIPADPNNGRKWPIKGKPEFKEREVSNVSYQAYATLADGTEVEGPVISIETAARAGWVYNNPNQWIGDMENMLYQRAAKRFCAMYGIGISGMTVEEARDAEPEFEEREATIIEPAKPTPAAPQPAPKTTKAKVTTHEVVEEPTEQPPIPQKEAAQATESDELDDLLNSLD